MRWENGRGASLVFPDTVNYPWTVGKRTPTLTGSSARKIFPSIPRRIIEAETEYKYPLRIPFSASVDVSRRRSSLEIRVHHRVRRHIFIKWSEFDRHSRHSGIVRTTLAKSQKLRNQEVAHRKVGEGKMKQLRSLQVQSMCSCTDCNGYR